jgi:hypothetical protein
MITFNGRTRGWTSKKFKPWDPSGQSTLIYKSCGIGLKFRMVGRNDCWRVNMKLKYQNVSMESPNWVTLTKLIFCSKSKCDHRLVSLNEIWPWLGLCKAVWEVFIMLLSCRAVQYACFFLQISRGVTPERINMDKCGSTWGRQWLSPWYFLHSSIQGTIT